MYVPLTQNLPWCGRKVAEAGIDGGCCAGDAEDLWIGARGRGDQGKDSEEYLDRTQVRRGGGGGFIYYLQLKHMRAIKTKNTRLERAKATFKLIHAQHFVRSRDLTMFYTKH